MLDVHVHVYRYVEKYKMYKMYKLCTLQREITLVL